MILLQRVLAIFLMLVGGFLTMSMGYMLETRWDPHPLILAAMLPTCAIFVGGLVLAWLSFSRAGLFDALLAIGGAGVTFLLLFRFGDNWDQYARHYGEDLQYSLLVGFALLVGAAIFIGLYLGQHAGTRLGGRRVSRPMLLASATSSTVAVFFLGKVTGTDVPGTILTTAIVLGLPMLCVVGTSRIGCGRS